MYEDDGEYMIQVWTDQDTTNKTIQLILQGIVLKFSCALQHPLKSGQKNRDVKTPFFLVDCTHFNGFGREDIFQIFKGMLRLFLKYFLGFTIMKFYSVNFILYTFDIFIVNIIYVAYTTT